MSRLFDAPAWHLLRTLMHRQFYVNYHDLNVEGLRKRRRAVPGYAARALMAEIDRLSEQLDVYVARTREAEYRVWTLERERRTATKGAP